ncbi:LuxR family transcriptional regulator [Paraburkholderia ferrariae]|uniref:LuxR family transcriptional regulator n=1 Tax=Paraburkholderia ferrariae TaxID=386056 RepID=UPI000A0268BE|nr:LuxR family transcriptional regulator [Paraburkholderia ferrariae]
MSEAVACETPREWARPDFPSHYVWAQFDFRANRGSHVLQPALPRIRLEIARAWQMVIRLKGVEALAIAQRIERQPGSSLGPATMAVRCELAAIKAAAFVLRDDGEAALAAALAALRLGAASPTAHVALTVCRCIYWRLGDLDSFHAVERCKSGVQPGRLRTLTTMLDLALDAAVELGQMRFHSARLLASDALDVARCFIGNIVPIDSLPACVMAQLMYEEGRLDEAEALVSTRLAGIRQGGAIEGAVRGLGLLARIAANRNRLEQALALLAEANGLATKHDWPRLQAASLAQQVELYVAAGRFDEAQRHAHRLGILAAQCGSGSSTLRFELARYHLLAQTRFALARTPDAVDLASLHRLHDDTVSRGDRYAAVTTALLLIEALLAADRREEAAEALVALLKQAADAGLYQTLIDCGERVAGLIDAVVAEEIMVATEVRELLPYARALMARRRQGAARKEAEGESIRDAARPATSAGLSEREHAIIGLMGCGLTNKQIAMRLRIAPETVKSYAKHLYAKLGARNRTEASMLASRLGLIRLSGRDLD